MKNTFKLIAAASLVCLLAACEKNGLDDSQDSIVAIDLGLPSGTKWAACNLGANAPEEYGDYFAWGEISTKTFYNWSTYKWCNGSSTTMTKYNDADALGTVTNEDDAARQILKGTWRIPTYGEWIELFKNCSVKDCTRNGVDGLLFTGTKEGYRDNSLFIPCNGFKREDSLIETGKDIFYWSSTISDRFYSEAIDIYYYSDEYYRGRIYRCNGLGIRPVRN